MRGQQIPKRLLVAVPTQTFTRPGMMPNVGYEVVAVMEFRALRTQAAFIFPVFEYAQPRPGPDALQGGKAVEWRLGCPKPPL